jgi:hypothetical protein
MDKKSLIDLFKRMGPEPLRELASSTGGKVGIVLVGALAVVVGVWLGLDADAVIQWFGEW